MRIQSFAASLALALPALAQTSVVFPAQAAIAEGEAGTTDYAGGAPWWPKMSVAPNDLNFHMQTITDLPATAAGSLQSIQYRRDSANLPGRNHSTFSVTMEVKCSTAPTTAASASTFFASNVGSDVQTVIVKKKVNFGANTWIGSIPEPFAYTVKLDTPFQYNAANGSLCVDVLHFDNDLFHPQRFPPQTVGVDVMTSNPLGGMVRSYSRCGDLSNLEPPIELSACMSVANVGGTDMVRAYAARQYGWHHSRGYLLGSWALGTPLPVPGGGCGTIDLDMSQLVFLDIAQSDDYYGIARWPDNNPNSPYNTGRQYLFDLPYNQYWAGYKLFLQELNYNVHNQQFSTTNWVAAQIPVYLPGGAQFGARVLYSAGPTSHGDAQGTLSPLGVAPVTKFSF